MLKCPATRCGTTNDGGAKACSACGTPLESYARMGSHVARLFNRGLTAAADGRMNEARDLFAAVVLWCPNDLVARNAYALACYCQRDKAEARRSWEAVLARSSRDEMATRGLLLLQKPRRGATATPAKQAKKHEKKSKKAPASKG